MEKRKFKIISKSREGATLVSGGHKFLVPWEEIKRMYVIAESGRECWLNDETQKKWDEADEILTNIATNVILQGHTQDASNQIGLLLTNGKLIDKLKDVLGITFEEAMGLAQQRFQVVSKALGINSGKSIRRETKVAKNTINNSVPKPSSSGERLADNPVLQKLKLSFDEL